MMTTNEFHMRKADNQQITQRDIALNFVFHRNVWVTLLSSSVSNSLCDVSSVTHCWQRLNFQEQKFASNCCHCQEGRWGISSQHPNSQWNMSLSLWLKNKCQPMEYYHKTSLVKKKYFLTNQTLSGRFIVIGFWGCRWCYSYAFLWTLD